MASSLKYRWSVSSINRNWADRTLRILLAPTPLSFAERRSVLQVLQQKGGIEMFKAVPGYPSQFIAVTKTRDIASDLINSSPLTYSVASHKKSPDITFIDLSRPDLLDGTKATINPGETSEKVDKDGQVHKQYELQVVGVDKWDHAHTAVNSPLNGPWPESYTSNDTFMSSILKQSLPHNMAAKGLAHWDYDLEQAEPRSHKMDRLHLAKWLRHDGVPGTGPESHPVGDLDQDAEPQLDEDVDQEWKV